MKVEGNVFQCANNWFSILPLKSYQNRPINFLEIGTHYGANLISVAETYAKHPESKLYCIDPWEDYDEYSEYKGQQNTIYQTFLKNINNFQDKHKIIINRGYSHNIVSTLPDNYFDIIYIDGNHESEYVLEDAVLCFRKLKPDGILIFDDYVPNLTKEGIDGFFSGYHKRFDKQIHLKNTQLFARKIK